MEIGCESNTHAVILNKRASNLEESMVTEVVSEPTAEIKWDNFLHYLPEWNEWVSIPRVLQKHTVTTYEDGVLDKESHVWIPIVGENCVSHSMAVLFLRLHDLSKTIEKLEKKLEERGNGT